MLQTFYENFGFFGSICLSFIGFLAVIFMVAGLPMIVKEETHEPI